MRLDHDHLKQDRTPAPPAPGMQLSQDDLSRLMSEAIARHGQQQRELERRAEVATLDDALEIARQLDIPAEHVLAIATRMMRERTAPQRKQVVKARRRRTFFMAAGLAAGFLAGAVVLQVVPVWLAIVGAALILAAAGIRMAMPVSDADAEGVELAPRPGVCRVCGDAAQSPASTFCEAHRYRGPGAQ
ncbi:MAG: hypothetical protein ACK47B_18365 [Armatimonadota bacterium]